MTFGSVCSGIEAASVAWKPLGWRAAWFSEIAKGPNRLLAYHYPDVPNLGDMQAIHEREEFGRPIDVLVGGTPCQSFSVAGLRGGLADPRGNLTLVYLAVAARARPRWLVWENVPGVLSDDGGRTFGIFLGGLAKLGYGFAYRILDAQFFGVPQRRRRVFVVGHLGSWRRAAAVLFERHSLRGDSPPCRESRADVAGEFESGVDYCLQGGGRTSQGSQGSQVNENVSFTLNTIDVHAVAYALTSRVGGGRLEREANYVTHSLRGGGFDASEDGTGRGTPLTLHARQDPGVGVGVGLPLDTDGTSIAVFDPWQVTSPANRSTPTPGLCHTLPAAPAAPAAFGPGFVRRLTPRECERLQGFPDDYTLCMGSDAQRYMGIGNSMAIPVIRWIGERIQKVEAIA